MTGIGASYDIRMTFRMDMTLRIEMTPRFENEFLFFLVSTEYICLLKLAVVDKGHMFTDRATRLYHVNNFYFLSLAIPCKKVPSKRE